MRFTGMMSIGGGEPVEVKFTGVADTPENLGRCAALCRYWLA
jgi:hypothetical protein